MTTAEAERLAALVRAFRGRRVLVLGALVAGNLLEAVERILGREAP